MKVEEESHWIAIADVLSGVMVVFLFIAVAYMAKAQERSKGYLDLKGDLFKELKKEFHSDLESWNAEIDEDSLTIRFRALDTLFEDGLSQPRPEFEKVIRDFFPRYAKLLYSAKFRDNIEELRIEGHTSSTGRFPNQSVEDSYVYNLELSQDRARSVLVLALGTFGGEEIAVRDWLRKNLTANGLSFSKPVEKEVEAGFVEDKEKSKRVEFRVRLKAEKAIEEMGGRDEARVN